MGSASLILTALLLSLPFCDGFDVSKWADETMKLPSSRRLPVKEALAAPAVAGLGEGVTATEYDDALGTRLRQLALAEYQNQGAWTRSTALGYNIAICGQDTVLCEEAYSLFLQKAREVYEPFEVDESKNNRGLFAAVSNEFDQHVTFHDHKRSCEVSGLVYVSLPNPDSGISFLVNDSARYVDVTQGVLYFWPGPLIHAPGTTKGNTYRISINMEFKTKGGVVPRIKERYRGTSSEQEQLPYSLITADIPLTQALSQRRISGGQQRAPNLGISNIGKQALKIYDSCGTTGSLMTEIPPGHYFEHQPSGGKSWGISSVDKKPACVGPEKMRGVLLCTAKDAAVACNPERSPTDEL